MRVIAHMVVGPGEADRFLSPVLDRIGEWADVTHVHLDALADQDDELAARSGANFVTRSSLSFPDHEGKFREDAWHWMEYVLEAELGDYVVCIDADEVIVDASALRAGIKEFPGRRLGVRFHHMWNETHYRVDGQWRPHVANIILPFRFNAHHVDRKLACGREPTYASTLEVHSQPVSDILHLGYMRDEDKQAKYDRYMAIDGGKFHSNQHIRSILTTPSLERWEKGGIIV